MNPGVQATMLAIVLLILVLFSWGSKTLEDAKMTPRMAGLLLALFVLFSGVVVAFPFGIRWDVAGVLIPILLTVWELVQNPSWTSRFHWLIGMLTVASSLVILMTLVPLDPAFFLLKAETLYPVVAVIFAIVTVRRPFAAVTIAVVGMWLATIIDPLLHQRTEVSHVVFGGGEVRDLLMFTACGVLLFHGLYHHLVRLLSKAVRLILRQPKPEGGPEHV
jgi:hypothetical protein